MKYRALGDSPSPSSAGLIEGRWGRVLIMICASTVLVWRLVTAPPSSWLRDWAAILSLYTLYSTSRGASPRWTQVSLSVMAYLLAIYILGQFSHLRSAWGWAP